jgi:type IX secretion system PorP/SprF family membrane protein
MRPIQRYIALILIVLATAPVGMAQVNTFSDQYLGNLLLLNPAIAGTGQYGTLTATSRQQWAGWNGAPASQSVTFHTKWAKADNRFNPLGFVNKGKNTYSKVGVGGGFFHESYGVFNLTGVHLNYAYHVFSRKGRLSFGLSPSLYQIGTSTLILTDPNDPYLQNPIRSYFVDFNAGVHYFTKEWYAGMSLIQLANSTINFGSYGFPGVEDASLNPDLARSIYAYGGYFFELNRSLKLKIEPMGVIKYNPVTGIRFDASTTVHLLDRFLGGVSYSFKRGLSVFTGVKLDNLSFRYLFEVPVSAEVPNRYTTHHIQLSVNIGEALE